MRLSKKSAVSFGLALVGMGLLVALSFLITRSATPLVSIPFTGIEKLNKLLTYQLVTLTAVVLMILATARLMPENFIKFFRVGNLTARAEPSKLLGIGKHESWNKIGIIFSVVISLVTIFIVLLPAVHGTGFSLSLPLIALAVLLAVSNAFVEEYVARFQVTASLAGRVSPRNIAMVSALLFGIPHYIGTPGGVLGAFLAGFLGWLLAKSVLETKGLGWAVFIHFLQDVIIFISILGLINQ